MFVSENMALLQMQLSDNPRNTLYLSIFKFDFFCLYIYSFRRARLQLKIMIIIIRESKYF